MNPHANRLFATTTHRYTITLSGRVVDDNAPRWKAAQWQRTARELGKADSLTLTHHAHYSESMEKPCFGCLARPVLWERDCDGNFPTSSCGEKQCDWWKCVRTRDIQRGELVERIAANGHLMDYRVNGYDADGNPRLSQWDAGHSPNCKCEAGYYQEPPF